MNKIELNLQLTWHEWEKKRNAGNKIELDILQVGMELGQYPLTIRDYRQLKASKDYFIENN